MMREMMGGSKDAMFVMEELLMFLDMTLHHIIDRAGMLPSTGEEESKA